MRISIRRFIDLCGQLGISAKWRGEASFARVSDALIWVAEEAGPEQAKHFLVHLLWGDLGYTQKIQAGLRLTQQSAGVLGEYADLLAQEGKHVQSATLLTLGLTHIASSARALQDIAADAGVEVMSKHIFDKTAMEEVFGLPWRMNLPDYPKAVNALLFRFGEYVGTLGVGPVAVDNKFTVRVPVRDVEGTKELTLWFGQRQQEMILLGHTHHNSSTLWAFAEGMDPQPITPNIERLPGIRSFLEIVPEHSQGQIQEAMGRLTFSFLRPG